MLARTVAYLVFIVVETLLVLAAIPVVFLGYLPYVALKGCLLTLTGKARPKALAGNPQVQG